ncbi:MAG: bifunctional adenosylcobinamide kinase/adenosylcobinamide-phosphate guanylyltransferase [Chloroflexi bacterium]|nr:bifunctional adenosylcobinamide kinase/adenosylcobinamide-phosphate guanylyltransferase [Chloroflexota bacterium]
MAHRRVLVLGGARSGKSAFAEQLATACGSPVLYVATAAVSDTEMADRIAHHRARRPAAWQTVEREVDLLSGIDINRAINNTIIVEDLTLLLSNHMERDVDLAESLTVSEIRDLLAIEANVILVSNEVGMGLVPMHALGRAFRDALGRVNQAAAAACSEVYFVVAGLPLKMK